MGLETWLWGDGGDERHFALRQIAAAVGPRLGSVLVREPSLAPEGPDGAFDIRHGVGRPDDPPHAGHDESAQLRPPAVTWAWLPLGAGSLPWSTQGARLILGAGPAPSGTIGAGSTTARVGKMDAPTTIVVTTQAEATQMRHLATSGPAGPSIANVGMALTVNPLALTSAPLGLDETDYVLILASWAGPDTRLRWPVAHWLHHQLVDELGDAVTVTVTVDGGGVGGGGVGGGGGGTMIGKGETWSAGPPVRGRTDLWRLMARARVMVDLRAPAYFGREALESLMIGTPIVVPDQGAAGDHARSAGSRAYATKAEMVSATVDLCRPERGGSQIEDQGKAWATTRFGDRDRFVGRVRSALGLA